MSTRTSHALQIAILLKVALMFSHSRAAWTFLSGRLLMVHCRAVLLHLLHQKTLKKTFGSFFQSSFSLHYRAITSFRCSSSACLDLSVRFSFDVRLNTCKNSYSQLSFRAQELFPFFFFSVGYQLLYIDRKFTGTEAIIK